MIPSQESPLEKALSQLLENHFEETIGQALSERGWLYEDDGKPTHWDVGLALHTPDVLHWLQTQYPDEYEKAIPSDANEETRRLAERRLLEHLTKQLDMKTTQDEHGRPRGGLLGVLKYGFKFAQVGRPTATFGELVVFPPANPLLTQVEEVSQQVRMRVLRQVRFDTKTNETIDIVLLVNGIPVVTMEVKTDNTQQVTDAIRQYREDRVPKATRPLLKPGRALVHFAVSNDLVYMTTKLEGAETTFLPFNLGNGGHEGNPPSPTGSATDYLWRSVLARPSFLRILNSFAVFEPGKTKKGDRLIFPRFHQFRAVERVVADVEKNGPGGRYLIWHSAGSGKTKTIAWLSHRLIRHVDAKGDATFDSVIIVTDRNALDQNIRDDINLVQSSKGLVVSVGEKSGAKSPQLKQALLEGNHIITCTLQTFPEVMALIEDQSELRGRRWVVVADEAHSSQSGSAARKLKSLLADVEVDESEDLSADDLLQAKDSAIAKSANITFVALTATPKAKTLRLFGHQVEDRWEAFDTYTMAQAIEEGFILDVLTNYSTYDMFVKVRHDLEEQAEEIKVDKGEAVTKIVKFARMHPTSIAQKVKVVVEHFRRNVMPLLGGDAKAMVVTSSRLEAVRWSRSMNDYIEAQGYDDMLTLVAFSGTVTDEGIDYTEVGMNNLPDVGKSFKDEPDHRVLIVANKFQTGFDEPLLQAMYVDKTLTGIATVQTLSRLNRVYPGKTAPMVLDFRNEPASVQQDFSLYYSDAHVKGEVDPNALFTLADRLDTAGLYTMDQLRAIASAFVNDEGGEELQRLCSPIKNSWSGQLKQARLNHDTAREDELVAFRADLISYQHAWEFLSQIVDYQEPDLHRRAILATVLGRNLHLTPTGDDDEYMVGVQLLGVHVAPDEILSDYSITEGSGDSLPLPVFDGEIEGGTGEAEQGPLSEAIKTVNELFKARGRDISDSTAKGFVSSTYGSLLDDQAVAGMAQNNTQQQFAASAGLRDAVELAAYRVLRESQSIQDDLSDPEFMVTMVKAMADPLYAALRARENATDAKTAKGLYESGVASDY